MPVITDKDKTLGSLSRKSVEIVYNITVKLDAEIEQAWLQWLINEMAPAILATDCFTKFSILKLLEVDDADSSTYAVQFFSKNLEDYQRYIKNLANDFTKRSFEKWGEKTF